MSDHHPPFFDDGPANMLLSSAPTPSPWKRCLETCMMYFTAACAMLFGLTFALAALFGIISFFLE